MTYCKKIISILFLLLTFQSSLQAAEMDDYLQGKIDAGIDVHSSPLWILAGLSGTGCCLFIGVAGIGVAAMFPPEAPTERLVGKSDSYVMGYMEEYRRLGRWGNVKYASAGCLVAAVINLAINLTLGFPDFSSYYR